MQHVFGHRVSTAALYSRCRIYGSLARDPVCARYECRGLATAPAAAVKETPNLVQTVAHLIAKDMSDAEQLRHVRAVRDRLEHDGILKISLRFADDTSQYLKNLVLSLHRHHGHGLPITHSASQGWFWDVKPSRSGTTFQTQNHQARSETMASFPWHTDCSYEPCPPRFFALHVLHPDGYGGGTLSVMNVKRLGQLLSVNARDALSRPDYRIRIPTEFIKQPEQRHIVGSILAGLHPSQSQSPIVRFRGELVTPLNEAAATALAELKRLLRELETQPASTLHLAATEMPRNSIILLDNRRWLHARDAVKDPARHLRRVRWDAVPFQAC
ncbi:uncharacterized protein CDV56_103030 [Aspergillus thermomutatus]|uniref:TauD/TfdA-like domain-containing protein n=1 Tax=Aspergillus thermomutatus TaxID=41047 RepID=A0A397G2N5_ASPTH|nr:uncharacterized protein CDV56_103030 [Aspergillus thermomutatus]RHZ44877.1 hypothetical protein CDV56_103030 [Aspergillus thermomutatus]